MPALAYHPWVPSFSTVSSLSHVKSVLSWSQWATAFSFSCFCFQLNSWLLILNPHQLNCLLEGQKCPYSCSVAPAALCWPSVGTVVNPLSLLAWNRSSFFALSQFSCFLFLLLKKCGCTLRILQATLKHLPSPCYQWLSPGCAIKHPPWRPALARHLVKLALVAGRGHCWTGYGTLLGCGLYKLEGVMSEQGFSNLTWLTFGAR